ncbi:MAG: hypothetical protein EHM41_05145 [Chloroflexi bacterium]|nr:MAG: hypothetical protein EHM41_05145 [Chloroflexota bacterium]
MAKVTGTAVLLIRTSQGKDNPPRRFEVPAGLTIQEVLLSIQLPTNQPLIALVNGSTAEMTYVLQPGDRVDLLPQIAGG